MVGKRIYFFIGTTAELIKLFPVIKEMEARRVDFKIITSGQTKIDFDEVKSWIRHNTPDISLPGKANESSVLMFLIWAIKTTLTAPFLLFRELMESSRPKTFFIVHGDTVTSLIGAIIARIFRLKVVHIESGLRSFDFLEPFPEEISRYVISRIANIHFCPNEWSLNNLRSVGGEKVNTFQNTFIESVSRVPSQKNLLEGKYFILILHRQEHVIFQKEKSEDLIKFVIRNSPYGVRCVFIQHVTSPQIPYLPEKVISFPRLPFSEFVTVLKGAQFIVTDGGGNQEESYYLGLPCLLLRNLTERVEGLGENVVLSKGNKRVIKHFLKNYKTFQRNKVNLEIQPSKIICDTLLSV